MFNTGEYLNSLKISKLSIPSEEFLRELHYAHLINIPYENIDIINKIPFSLDEDDLFKKIIIERRGGFCYELTILFKRLLVELGFKVDLISARILHLPGNIWGPDFDHSVLIVTLREKWLADIGNSLWFHNPIKLENNVTHVQFHQTFRICSKEDIFILMEKKSGEDFEQPQYYFSLIPRDAQDFSGMCEHKWTSPDSKFTKEYICSRATLTGRILLKNSLLLIFENGVKYEKKIDNRNEFKYYMGKYFDNELTESIADDLLPLKLI